MISHALEDESWVEAMQEELLQFKLQKVWILVDLPFGQKAIGTKWFFRNKRDERCIVVKNKARLVAQRFRQEEGINYDEVFAPVARIEAIRLFLAFASFMGFPVYQMDVKSAFLYATIVEEVYVHQPPGFVDPAHPNKVYKVIKALYGLHQAPRAWYETLSSFLLENGFRRGTIDKTLFINKNKSDIMLVQLYVDDIIFSSTTQSMCTDFEYCMHKRFQMSSMGKLTFFLGLQVKQQPDGIFISQDKYVADILKNFDFCSIKTATTPIKLNKPLVKGEDGVDVDVHVYRSMIGSLMYLTASRSDIMFAVCACARFQVTPKVSHLNAVKRIFRYLKHQPTLGLWNPKDSPFKLEALSDSDYGGADLDRKLTTGGCQFLDRRLISWQCKKQTIVANSTTEAEYVATANYCEQVLWIQNQIMDYGFNFMNTKIHINNESTISIVKNPFYHSRTKHIEIQHHFIRDCYEKRLIDVIKIHTDVNVADLLTKVGINTAKDKHRFEDGWKLCCLQVNSGSLQVNSGRQKLILICHVNTELKMANLRYSDKHNMVAFLKKPTESVGFTKIVYFLKGTSLRTLANGIHELVASIDNKEYTITETSIRSQLQLADATGEHVSLLPAMLAGAAPDQGEGSAIPAGSQPTLDPMRQLLQVNEAPFPEGNTLESAEDSLNLKELMDIVPKLVLRIDHLEKELQQTKSTYGKAFLTLVERVKLVEAALKRKSRKVILFESEDQGRKIQDIDDDPLVSLVKNSMEEKEANFVTPKKVASQNVSTYKRRARSAGKGKDVDIGLDFFSAAKERLHSAKVEVNTEVNPGIQTVNVIVPSPVKSQREGKAPMTSEDVQATQNTKEQIRQEEVGLAEAMRLQALQDKENARQKRKAKVQEAAQFYIKEYWDTIRAKLEANAELTKSLQGENVSSDDFAKRMVDMINQKKKYYAKQKAKAKRDKPMTQVQQRDYMSTVIKNQGSWKMAQLKKLTFEELKVEFEKLMRSIKSFIPMGSKERVKRVGVQLEQDSSKKQKTVGIEEPDKTAKHEAEEDMEALVKGNDADSSSGTDIPVSAVPVAIKPPSIANWKIIKLGNKVMQKYGTNRLEDEYERVFWGDLKTMFDSPLSTDPVWNLPYQQKVLS
ncbi:putative ribonuclease H-like domain-containing protein [Tanacetum coccineum]